MRQTGGAPSAEDGVVPAAPVSDVPVPELGGQEGISAQDRALIAKVAQGGTLTPEELQRFEAIEARQR